MRKKIIIVNIAFALILSVLGCSTGRLPEKSKLEFSTLKNFEYWGNININSVTIKNTLKGNGDTNIEKTYINSAYLEANYISLNNSTIEKDLYVKKNKFGKKPKLYLKNKSLIKGKVIFENNEGEVYIDKTSKIEGAITSQIEKCGIIKVDLK